MVTVDEIQVSRAAKIVGTEPYHVSTGPTRPFASASAAASGTTTITIQNSDRSSSSSPQAQQQPEVLFLPLNRKKKVTWKEGTVDNEFMQKKSSKKCCIFHKENPFDEDDSDEDDGSHRSDKQAHNYGDGECCS